jgi:ribosome modulation factor
MRVDPLALARAFNEGSDARITGISFDSCWYKSEQQLKDYWQLGWQDVDKFFGRDAKWSFTPLPKIK